MAKTFKGRVIIAGDITGEAAVTHHGFNTLATYYAGMADRSPVCHDQGNPDLYQKEIAGKIICLPATIGSTTGGMIIQCATKIGIGPKAMLYAEHIDTVSAAGILLSQIWDNNTIVCIDQLGKDFLDSVKIGDKVTVKSDGTVTIG